jgi:hypothetical protein
MLSFSQRQELPWLLSYLLLLDSVQTTLPTLDGGVGCILVFVGRLW